MKTNVTIPAKWYLKRDIKKILIQHDQKSEINLLTGFKNNLNIFFSPFEFDLTIHRFVSFRRKTARKEHGQMYSLIKRQNVS